MFLLIFRTYIGCLESNEKNLCYLWVDLHQPCEFQENRIKTATCILTSYIYKYINIADS